MYTDCANCNATIPAAAERCPVCGFDGRDPKSAIVVFSPGGKEASDGLGGILEIIPVSGLRAKFIAKCSGGLFALGVDGELLWRQDWMHVSSVEVKGVHVAVNGILLNVDSGTRV